MKHNYEQTEFDSYSHLYFSSAPKVVYLAITISALISSAPFALYNVMCALIGKTYASFGD